MLYRFSLYHLSAASAGGQSLLLLFYCTLGLRTDLRVLISSALSTPLLRLFGGVLSMHLFTISTGALLWNIALGYIDRCRFDNGDEKEKGRGQLLRKWGIDLDSVLLGR
jgi:hypothetical protein